MELIRKDSTGQKIADTMTFVLTTETPDRVGDIVVLGGLDTKSFLDNPVALVHHNMGDFPVGVWSNVRKHGDALLGDLRLAAKGTSKMADTARALIEQGILKAVSITFRPFESTPLKPRGFRFSKSELLEVSLVSVPMNPRALLVAKSIGMSDEEMKVFFREPSSALEDRAEYGEFVGNPQETILRAKHAIIGAKRITLGVTKP